MNHLKTLGILLFLSVTICVTSQNKKAKSKKGQAIEVSVQDSLTDIDGNKYKTVKIGTQVWMAENLKVTHYCNGEVIPNVTSNSKWAGLSTGAWCVYENDASYGKTYGNLYNWYAVVDARQLAPKGWHVPTDAEWTKLMTYLGRVKIAGGKLKEGATNKSGFSALPGGGRYGDDGAFNYVGSGGDWWSSISNSAIGAYSWSLGYGGSVNSYVSTMSNGYSVRCLRDSQ